MARIGRMPAKKKRGGAAATNEEVSSLTSEVLWGTDHPNQATATSAASSTTLWKVVSMVLLASLILVLSTSLEFRVIQGGEGQDMDGHGSMGETLAHKQSAYESDAAAAPGSSDGPTAKPEPLPDVPDPEDAQGTNKTNKQNKQEGMSTERITYRRRGQPLSDEDRQAMIEQWGSWTLVDDKREQRPTQDMFAQYPNRDMPRSNFPANAWQFDTEYLAQFLPQALALVERAQHAILAEYGHYNTPEDMDDEMFRLTIFKNTSLADVPDLNSQMKDAGNRGGWTSHRSWEGLKRRLLHAIISEDSFVFAMGGHSAAAGHGNHFQQSYTLQVQWILEAVFARLGVRHQARNFGLGGLGTLQSGLATKAIYGPDVDVLMWDSSMTEKEGQALDVFARQAILGEGKAPVIWSLLEGVATVLHDQADVDVGAAGGGRAGIPEWTNTDELDQIPWAAQYVRCSGELSGICRENEYMGDCWIDREDFTPPTNQKQMGGRARWHPGNRIHQVTGRVLAYTILTALHEVLATWNEADGYMLNDEDWHVTAYYENTRSKVAALAEDVGWCSHYYQKAELPNVCNYPMQARTEFTPRFSPPFTNIRNLMPPEQAENVGVSEKPIYDPPDVFNPNLHPPAGAVDVLNIVENGVDFQSVLNPDYSHFYPKPSFSEAPKVTLGKGIQLSTKAGDDFCDGSVDSFCDRGAGNGCLLYGHNDGRNGLLFDGYSGWLVMNLPKVKNGFILVKMECWHSPGDMQKTADWESVNNEGRRRIVRASSNATTSTAWSTTDTSRHLKAPPPEYCEEFRFEFAIDGKITSYNKEEFLSHKQDLQRVVETVTLLNDPGYTGGAEKEVEVAIRMAGCGHTKNFQLTHVYWS